MADVVFTLVVIAALLGIISNLFFFLPTRE
jgi:hypothetical protein